MTQKAFQDYYPDHVSHCYGCGRLNEHGLQIKSYWDGDETVCHFRPSPHYTAIPGYVYGGLLASLIDCHSTGSAAAAVYRAENRAMDTQPPVRFVTASLHVDFLKPTPLSDDPIELRSQIKEVKERKVTIATDLSVKGEVCVRGEAVLVKVPDKWMTPESA